MKKLFHLYRSSYTNIHNVERFHYPFYVIFTTTEIFDFVDSSTFSLCFSKIIYTFNIKVPKMVMKGCE